MHGHIPTLSRLLQCSAVLAFTLFLIACRREVPVETITSMAVADDKGVMTIRRSHRVAAVSVLHTNFCDHWASLEGRALEFATAPANTPPTLTTNFDATTAFVWSLRETAPPGAGREFYTYAVVWSDYADIIIRNGYNLTAIEIEPAVQDALRNAGTRVNAWSRANCVTAPTVPTEIHIAMVGSGAPVFPASSPERTVQNYVRAVADRDFIAALTSLPASLAPQCRDAIREAISLRESNAMRAVLELTTRRDATAEGRVRVSESFPAGGIQTARSVVFLVQQVDDRWQIVDTSWPATCPARVTRSP